MTIDELETEGSGAASEVPQQTTALLRVIGISTGITIHKLALQRAVDEDRQFTGGCRDGVGFADTGREPSIEGTERGLRAAEAHRRQPQNLGGAVRRGLRSRTQQTTAGDPVFGGPVSQDVKCFSVGHRDMSVPISESNARAV
jgi:hypothetical protein